MAVILIGIVVFLVILRMRHDPLFIATQPIKDCPGESDIKISLTTQNDPSGVALSPLRSEESSSDEGRSHRRASVSEFVRAHPLSERDSAAGVRWLSATEAARFQFDQFRSKAMRLSTSESWRPRIIRIREDAITYLNKSLSMALSPSIAFEDTAFFYFSGGNTAYEVKDFSQGIVISRATGDLMTW